MKFKLSIFALTVFVQFSSIHIFGQTDTPNFYEYVETRIGNLLSQNKKKPAGFSLQVICPTESNFAAQRVFEEYGAVFVGQNGIALPQACIYESDEAVQNYQAQANQKTENIGGISVTLQTPAMNALLEARTEALKNRLSITPRGSIGSKRSYSQTLTLWNSRFSPALNYWVKRGKISRQEADEARAMPISRQVERVLRWEEKGLYFSTDFRKSILYSVAVPGASQHIFLLALDVQQFGNKKVREILAKHGWFQTVKSDAPHFTYLGVAEEKLPTLGLREEWSGGQKFWVPNL